MPTVSETLDCLDTARDQAQEARDIEAVEIIKKEIATTKTVKTCEKLKKNIEAGIIN